MIAERWEHIKELFETALNCSEEERQSFLANLTRQDSILADEVAKLLSSFYKAGDFLVHPYTLTPEFLEQLETEQHRFSPGDVLCDRFRIVHLIGRGGMGEVYEARDRDLDDQVAMKVLRFEISTHELFITRFRREIQLARKVTHPNVCRIFDSFKHAASDGTYITVLNMELLHGQTLAEHLKASGRLSAGEALSIIRQTIAGLSAIHTAGIVHRDLKPANLVLVPDVAAGEGCAKGFTVKITDFGIAGRLPDGISQSTETPASRLMGTPDYMAPEQLESARTSVQSDIYSLGLILYEMVTGCRPFAGRSAWTRITTDPPFPRKLGADVPANWARVILCCLERNPEYRFQSAQTVLEGLEAGTFSPKIPQKPFLLLLQRRAKSSIGIVALFLFFVMALIAWFYRYFKQSPEVPSGTMVFVTDIATSDPSLSGVTVALKSQLAQSTHFEVEEDSKIVDVLKQMSRNPGDPIDIRTAREVAWRSGSPLVIFGSLSKTNQGYVLSMKVERVKHNPILPTVSWKRDFVASSQPEILESVHRASTWIRDLAGETEADLSHQDRPVEDTTTSSWLALEHYGDAETKYNAGDIGAAALLLKEAIATDPKFAKAHMRLADILISQKRYNEGYAEWKTAFELVSRQNLTDRESLRIQGQYYEDNGDYDAAEKKFHEYVIHYPNDYLAWFYWGSALDTAEQKEDAIEAFSKAVELRPQSYSPHEHLATLYLLLGRFEQAEREIETVRALGSVEWATWLGAQSAFLQGRYDLAIQTMVKLRSSPSVDWQSESFSDAAKFLAECGELREAISSLEQGIEYDRSRARLASQEDKELALAYLLYREHSFGQSSHVLLNVVENGTSNRLAEAGTLLARMGFRSNAKQVFARLVQQAPNQRAEFAKSRLRGEIELVEGQNRLAIRDFSKAVRLARPREQHDYLGHGFQIAGMKQASRDAYKNVLNHPGRVWINSDSPFFGLWSFSALEYLRLVRKPDSFSCHLVGDLQRMWIDGDVETKLDWENIQHTFRTCQNVPN